MERKMEKGRKERKEERKGGRAGKKGGGRERGRGGGKKKGMEGSNGSKYLCLKQFERSDSTNTFQEVGNYE